jgi:toxin CptA
MSKSRRLSNTSAPCRFEWVPSHWLTAALIALALLAPFSLLASDLPPVAALPLALLAGAWGIREVRLHRQQPPRTLVIPAGAGETRCDGLPMTSLSVRWRGPLAFLRWRDPGGRDRRLVFWPDTLPAAARRELKLALQKREAAGGGASMAG